MKEIAMKKFLILFGLVAVLAGPAMPVAKADINLAYTTALTTLIPFNLIDWKVGDTAEYSLLGGLGSMVKKVTKDEGTAIWVQQDVNIIIQKQKIEMLISKVDGKILKMLLDGKEQAIPNDPIEIISQDYGDVTVPAGTFQAVHIIAKTKQIAKIEAWINPRDTVMDGTIKQIANQNGMDIVIELTKFTRMP